MIVKYEEGMSPELGVGWNAQHPEYVVFTRGGYTRPSEPEHEPSYKDDFSESIISSFSMLLEKASFALDAEGKGTIGVFKANIGASYSTEREIFRNSRNVVWMVSYRRKYEAVATPSIGLTPEGQTLLDADSGSIEIVRKMGSHVVTKISKVTEVHLIYVFTVSKTSLLERVKSAISGSIKSPASGGAGTATIEKTLRQIDEGMKIDYTVRKSGRPDQQGSENEITEVAPHDLSQVEGAMRGFLNKIRWKNAMVHEFTAEPLNAIYDVPDLGYDDDIFTSRVARLKDTQRRIIKRYLALQEILDRSVPSTRHEYDTIVLKEGAAMEIRSEMSRLMAENDHVAKMIADLQTDPTTYLGDPNLELSTGVLHWLVLDFGQFNEWRYSVSGNHYNWDARKIHGTITYWPVFRLRNTDYIELFEILRDGVVVASLNQAEIRSHLNNGILDIKPIFASSHNCNIDCRPEQVNTECNPHANDKRRLANDLRNRETNFSYEYRITDVEKTVILRPFGNVASRPL